MGDFALDDDQRKIIDWRLNGSGLANMIGPPGAGKTTTTSFLAFLCITNQLSGRFLLTAYTNNAANESCRELFRLLGKSAKDLCVRTGNPAVQADTTLPIPFSNHAEEIRKRKIIVCTNMSMKNLPQNISFDNMVIDEAGGTRLEHMLWPLQYGINQIVPAFKPDGVENRVQSFMDLVNECGVTATIVGDPKQSRPISTLAHDYSAIEWSMRQGVPSKTLLITHRLPGPLAGLVNDFAEYGGLKSSPDIEGRRLQLTEAPDPLYRDIIKSEDVITWGDLKGEEDMFGASSWMNDSEARACAKLCGELRRVAKGKTIAIISRYTAQRAAIKRYLRLMGLNDVIVQTTTAALGTQADIVIVSLTRNNEENFVGAIGTLEDLNVAISRAKEKLIILGNFEMMSNGWSSMPTMRRGARQSPIRKLTSLVEKKYGRIVEVPLAVHAA